MQRKQRIAILGGIALLAVAAAINVLTWRTTFVGTLPAARKDGGAAIRAPERPAISGSAASGVYLAGTVIDGAGLPVAHAEVSAEPERGVVERALQTGDAGVPADAGAAAAIAVAAATGADGRFVIDGLAPGRYHLHVSGPGLLAAEVRYVPVPSDEARIVVARQVAIDGTVTDGGKPVASANVGIRGDAIGGTMELKTDARGAFHAPNLPEGRYQVFAWQGALAARAVRVNLLGAGPFGALELRLEAAAIVVGRVIDKDGGAGLAAAIELRPSGDDQAPRYARSDDSGAFRIEGVPSGRWIADAFAPGYLSQGGLELEAGRGVPELALARGAVIEGRVLDADGQPIDGAAVRALTAGSDPIEYSAQVDQDRLRRFSGRSAAPAASAAPATDLIARGELGVMTGPIPPIPPPGAQVAQPAQLADVAGLGEPPPLPADPDHDSIWTTGADGRYRIRGLGRGKLVVLAQAAGFAEARSRQVAVTAGETLHGVDIVVTAGTFVIGRVTDQHGAPVVGAELSARPDVGAPASAFTDADGAYRLGPLVGAIELRASAYGHVEVRRPVELPAARGTVAAEHHEDLVLAAADATLAGTLDDTTGVPVAGAHLEVIGEDRRGVVAADGTFVIDMLPPGPVRVRVEHPDYPPDELAAVASSTGERVRLVLALGGAVEGVLLDNSTGAALPSVPVTASGPGGATAEAASDKDGHWKLGPLKPGHWKISARLAGYLPQTREVDVTAARTPGATSVRDVRIDLLRGAVVGGTVRDGRGQRVGAAHVVVHGDAGTAEGDTDAQGEFRLRDCPTGDVTITATRDTQTGTTTATVRPGDEVLGLAIDVR